MDPVLAQIYGTNSEASDLEKLASAQMEEELGYDGSYENEQYADDDVELLAQAVLNDIESEQSSYGYDDVDDETMAKVAEADKLGRVMAHSMWQELGNIKIAKKVNPPAQRDAPELNVPKSSQSEYDAAKKARAESAATIDRLKAKKKTLQASMPELLKAREAAALRAGVAGKHEGRAAGNVEGVQRGREMGRAEGHTAGHAEGVIEGHRRQMAHQHEQGISRIGAHAHNLADSAGKHLARVGTSVGNKLRMGGPISKGKAQALGAAAYGLGTLGAAGLGYGAKKAYDKSKESSALDTLAEYRALEILEANGIDVDDLEKTASSEDVLGNAVENRALEILSEFGLYAR